MRRGRRVAVVIPAMDEAAAIGRVLAEVPGWVDECIVADNGSTDGTGEIAAALGARVVRVARRGYGSACLAGVAAAVSAADVVVFLDGDYSDNPAEMDRLVDPVLRNEADLVVGSRVLGRPERGALPPQARFGNWLATRMIRLFWGARFTDLGPFRAVRGEVLRSMGMTDPDYGWTVEMQLRAVRQGIPWIEVPVGYRRRIGRSKITGTVKGVVGAGTKILWTILRARLGGLPTPERWRPREAVVLFTRFPRPGTTKTRLIPALGPRGAADLQRRMTEQAAATVRAAQARRGFRVEVRHEGGSEEELRRWLGAGWTYRAQGPGDLGARLDRAVREAFSSGAARVVLLGADCPGLRASDILRALRALDRADAAVGPSADGGYYLLGLRRVVPGLFEAIPWGTASVRERTLAVLRRRGLKWRLLPVRRDVDRPEDLVVLRGRS
ncbi:DUF2064 domain-containing protein [Dissulfurirhabdus thermomarina]|uniref:DUF2064 domain-containing protein n=2 Tax=Dissulfurirhabdus thermomarina TaxID=1765737 RepID=A0A6N9TNL5_DISTH|nr:DUF2064 domain-containing protein [Dissulfurirhabdus thermomarina]